MKALGLNFTSNRLTQKKKMEKHVDLCYTEMSEHI